MWLSMPHDSPNMRQALGTSLIISVDNIAPLCANRTTWYNTRGSQNMAVVVLITKLIEMIIT